MRKFKIKKRILLAFTILLSSTLYGQSISGNMRTMSESNLAYGNVNVYQHGEKVAAVLTDAEGNFKVKLDTGYYEVELMYEGYKKMTKSIHVTNDNRSDFNLAKKEGYKAPVYESTRDEMEYSKDKEARIMFSETDAEPTPKLESKRIKSDFSEYTPSKKEIKNNQKGQYGTLTAGEINDFSKWEMWKDIATDQLAAYSKKWDLFPSDRYTIQLVNKDGFPISDASVELRDNKNKVHYESRTDNTGKAELWGSLTKTKDDKKFTAHIKCRACRRTGNNRTYRIKDLTLFEEGINTLEIKADCGVSDQVDIAFVVDGTGSMGDEINFLKEELNHAMFSAQNEHTSLTFNFANVFYRDQGDDYVTRMQDFTNVLSTAVEFINAQSARGGGDYEEAVEIALDKAINTLSWSESARSKILFLVLDAPPHQTPEILKKLKTLLKEAAKKGIRIVPIAGSGIQKDTEYLMRTLALATNGTYAFLSNHSGIGNSHIEPTTDEYDVELLKNLLVRLIDSYTYVPTCEEEVKDSIVASPTGNSITWKAWPNPTRGQLQIQIEEDVEELFLVDLTGKIMQRFTDIKKSRPIRTNIGQYAKGIYLLTFTKDEEVYTKKVILN